MDIQIKNLSKSFEKQQVISDLSFVFEQGKNYVITGPSGQGKTTLIRILLGLSKADRGEVIGLESQKIAAVFQENRLCEHITALNNVRMVSPRKENKGTVPAFEQMFATVGLTESMHQKVSTLSGGMKRRVAILRALAYEPDVLIMDEPYQGLDEENYQKARDLVSQKMRGKTVIVVSHDPRDWQQEGVHLLEIGN